MIGLFKTSDERWINLDRMNGVLGIANSVASILRIEFSSGRYMDIDDPTDMVRLRHHLNSVAFRDRRNIEIDRGKHEAKV